MYFHLSFPYSLDTIKIIKAIPGRKFDPSTKKWSVPKIHAEKLTPLLLLFPREVANEIVLEARKNAAEREDARKGLYTGDLPLFEFQKEGAVFLEKSRFALLADTPGCGKTIQTIAALDQEQHTTLIVCPASLKYMWQEEIKKWRPDWVTTVITGTKEKRTALWQSWSNIFIANYELLLHDKDIMPTEWYTIVSDESTRLANTQTKGHAALRALRSVKRIALTGTPVSNSPSDLFGIFTWLSPGYLGTFTQFSDMHLEFNQWGSVSGFKNLDALKKAIAPYTLRRTKEQVLKDFPAKLEQVVAFDLFKEEAPLYTSIKKQLHDELSAKLFSKDPETLAIAPVLMLRLKQATDHPSLVTDDTALHPFSAKFDVLCETLLPILKSGEKVLIFTQFASMAKKLCALLPEIFPDQIPLLIEGAVSAEDRQKAVETFQSDPTRQIFILTEAGASGLTLTAASYVVHYDLSWSVAKKTQREDRAHRIGQTKPVTVYTLVAKDTIDEYVQKVLARKQETADELLVDTARFNSDDWQTILS